MRATTLLLAGALATGLLASGCAKRAPESAAATAAPHPLAPELGAAAGELAAVSAALAQNAASLAALGVDTSRSRDGEKPDAPTKRERDEIRDGADEKSSESATDLDDAPTPKTPVAPKSAAPSPSTAPTATARTTAEPSPEPVGAASDEASGCDRICALAGVACDLAQRICTLAKHHEGDARYADVCWNAERQCEQASDACADCSAC